MPDHFSIGGVDDDRCDRLRWKGMYVQAEWDASVPQAGDRLFWCQETQKCIGPDNRVVDDYECNPTRGCYKPY
jgi:hypothetical protein